MQRKLSGVVPAPALIVNSLLAMTQTSRIACHPAGITLDVLPLMPLFPQSLSENSEGCCFRAQAGLAGRDEGTYPPAVLRPRINNARPAWTRKPSGRRRFCPGALLLPWLQPATGMLRQFRLAQGQNSQSQHPCQFSDRLSNQPMKP